MKIASVLSNKNVFALVILVCVLVVGATTAYAINAVSEGYQLTTSPQRVEAYGTCYMAQTTGGSNVFFPTRTAAEWNSFVNSHPANVVLNACAAPCTDWRHVETSSNYTKWYVFKPIGGNPGAFRVWWDQNPLGWPVVVAAQPYTATSYISGGYRYERGVIAWNVTDYASYYIRRCPL